MCANISFKSFLSENRTKCYCVTIVDVVVYDAVVVLDGKEGEDDGVVVDGAEIDDRDDLIVFVVKKN